MVVCVTSAPLHRECFDAVYGSRAGAINATYFLSGQREGVRIYSEDIANKQFVDLSRLLDRKNEQGMCFSRRLVLLCACCLLRKSGKCNSITQYYRRYADDWYCCATLGLNAWTVCVPGISLIWYVMLCYTFARQDQGPS